MILSKMCDFEVAAHVESDFFFFLNTRTKVVNNNAVFTFQQTKSSLPIV